MKKLFIKYKENDSIVSKTVFAKKASFGTDGSWVELEEGKRIKVFFVMLISEKWFSETALAWFDQYLEEK